MLHTEVALQTQTEEQPLARAPYFYSALRCTKYEKKKKIVDATNSQRNGLKA